QSPTGPPTSAMPPKPEAPPLICTYTTPTSSGYSAGCRGRSSPQASSRTEPFSISRRNTSTALEDRRLPPQTGPWRRRERLFFHAFEIYLDRATLLYESGATPLTVLTADGKSKQPRLKSSSDPTTAFTAELQTAVQGIKTDREPDLLSGKLARDALVLCQKE